MEELEHAEDQLSLTIEEAFLLLESRAARVGQSYPFVLADAVWVRGGSWQDRCEYALLTLLNQRIVLGLGEVVLHHRPAMLFERLVKTALSTYVNGDAARFGVPHSEFDGDFAARARGLAGRMRERAISDLTTITPQQGDYGLDVAAWRSFDDRASQLVILCQCGIGADFLEKTLPSQRWTRVIDFVCAPLTALAIPFQDFAPDARTKSLAVDAGILLDRTRIARFADADLDPNLRGDIVDWIVEALPSFIEDPVGTA